MSISILESINYITNNFYDIRINILLGPPLPDLRQICKSEDFWHDRYIYDTLYHICIYYKKILVITVYTGDVVKSDLVIDEEMINETLFQL